MTRPTFTVRSEGFVPSPDGQGETLRVFCNGRSAGLVTLYRDEAQAFRNMLATHAAMVEALRAVVAAWDSVPPLDSVPEAVNVPEMWVAARAALAKVDA